MRTTTLTALAALTLPLPLLGACAASATGDAAVPAESARQCFSSSQVTNFRTGSVNTVYLRAGRSDVFELQSTGFCRDLDSANAIVISPLYSGGDRLCGGDDAAIAIRGSRDAPCRVRVIRKLTADEVAALPGRERP